jgi:ABC-type Na+ efflux pump permease subunit
MSATLVQALWMQRASSPARLAILLVLVLLPLIAVTAMPGAGLSVLGDGFGVVLVLAVGMIGQDSSSGVLQLLLARPVRRWEYVTSRWVAVGAGASLVSLTQVALAAAILGARGRGVGADEVGLYAAARVLESFGLAAVMTLLSALVSGFGDLVLYLLLQAAGGVLQAAGHFRSWPAALRIGTEIQGFLSPRIDLQQWVAAGPSWFGIASYLSTIALSILLAVLVMNRRELSYASG